MTDTCTPGPFPLHTETNGEQIAIVTNQGNLYAKTFDPSAARLIAAAPDLLLALGAIVKQAGFSALAFPNAPGRGDLLAIVQMASAAIANATGRGEG
jgi:hypothetical protein